MGWLLATQSPPFDCGALTSGMFLETILVAGGVGSSDLENRLLLSGQTKAGRAYWPRGTRWARPYVRENSS